ncbi:MAG TPA: hypothetical protein VM735_06325 [Candidatus Kapabacteria bacterium]|nr:hypothetical protein [Candidatus Kapabacteria bacterium]
MTAKDLLGYQFGNAESIRRVAGSKYLLPVGTLLVLITSIPRNYDQTFIGEVPWWPLIPLVSSFVSGSFVFYVLKHGFIKEADGKFSRKYWMFLGLFWMTAPIAWLYGIPVERWMTARSAAVANLWLMGIVSIWRVALFSRVMSVIYEVPWLRTGGWVLLAASLEVAAVLFFSGFGEAIGRGMAGMRNSPEQNLIIGVLGTVFWTAVIAVPLLLIVLKSALRFPGKAKISELPECNKTPWLLLLCIAVIWGALAILPQQELAKEWKYRALLEGRKPGEALAYLNTLEAKDWPPARSFRPDPYEFEVWRLFPDLMEQVNGSEKPWVQEKLLWVFERTFDHRFTRYKEEDYLKILKGIEKFESGEKWIRESEVRWKENPMILGRADWTNLVSYLEGKGVDTTRE